MAAPKRKTVILVGDGMGDLPMAELGGKTPVLVFEDHSLWFQSGPVPGGDHLVPIGVAGVRREGSDVTVVTIGSTQRAALDAAQDLSAQGISVEVIDPRTLVPLDEHAILNSVARTSAISSPM